MGGIMQNVRIIHRGRHVPYKLCYAKKLFLFFARGGKEKVTKRKRRGRFADCGR